MTRPLSARMSRLGTETAFEVLAKARALEAQGRDIIHLEIGEPDFNTPPSVVQAGLSALQRGETHYTASAGIVELREAIANHLNRTRHLSVDPGQVIVTPGAKPIMFYAMLALLDAGDEAIYPDPGFPIYGSMISFAGAKGVPLKLREKNDFNPDLDELKTLVTDRTKVIVLNSPENPTGGVLTQSVLKEIAQIARARDLWVLADEIYAEILYEGTHRSITNSVSCTATFTQRAGAAALTNRPPEVAEMVKAFRERRDAVVNGLNKIDGITCREPKGAFYVFPNITGLGLGDSATVQERILHEAGIATLSGTAFGAGGEGHLRLSYANSLKNLHAAVTRIGEWAHVARQGRVAAAAGSVTSADR